MKDFISKILSEEVQQFIIDHKDMNLNTLLLKKQIFGNLTNQDLASQIKARKTAEKKFPFLLAENIVFPPTINLEQSSSEETAKYKSQFFSGEKFVDLTCGFGIDSWFLSKNFKEITLVEQNSELVEIVRHNWNAANKKANFVNENLEIFLKNHQENFDLIYIDPARRDAQNRKMYLLEDLSPNFLEIQDILIAKSKRVLIKLSPLIDLNYLMCNIKNISEIHIVAVKNEVKEILIFIKRDAPLKTQVICTNLLTDEPTVSLDFNDIKNEEAQFSEPEQFLFIPNNALLKSGAFNWISKKFNIKKLHPNTHLYTNDSYFERFPGRVLEIESIESSQIKKNEKYNIISKNHPLTPEQIKKKYKLIDGGTQYLIFTQSLERKLILRSK